MDSWANQSPSPPGPGLTVVEVVLFSWSDSCSPQVADGVDTLSSSSHSPLGVVVLVGIVVLVLSSSSPQVAEGVDKLSSSSHSRLGVVVLVGIVVLVELVVLVGWSSFSFSVAESP
jgi:hypothetical protein